MQITVSGEYLYTLAIWEKKGQVTYSSPAFPLKSTKSHQHTKEIF